MKKHKLFFCIFGGLTIVFLIISVMGINRGEISVSEVIPVFGQLIGVGAVIYFALDQSRRVRETPLTPEVEQARKEAIEHAKQAERLDGPPCRIVLLWKKHTGSPAKNFDEEGTDITMARVFLNGQCQKKLLQAGAPMSMQTYLNQNELLVAHRGGIEQAQVDSMMFEAEPGGRYLITLDYSAGTLTLTDNDDGEYNNYFRTKRDTMPVRYTGAYSLFTLGFLCLGVIVGTSFGYNKIVAWGTILLNILCIIIPFNALKESDDSKFRMKKYISIILVIILIVLQVKAWAFFGSRWY